jgi:hypothetical protein
MQSGLEDVGEVPIHREFRGPRQRAVNLTTQPNPQDQEHWNAQCGPLDKTKIRISVDLARTEVENFEQVRQRFRIPAKWVRLIRMDTHAYDHFFYFGRIPRDRFTAIEMWKKDGYTTLTDDELSCLEASVNQKKGNLIIGIAPGGIGGKKTREVEAGTDAPAAPCSNGTFRGIPFGRRTPATVLAGHLAKRWLSRSTRRSVPDGRPDTAADRSDRAAW